MRNAVLAILAFCSAFAVACGSTSPETEPGATSDVQSDVADISTIDTGADGVDDTGETDLGNDVVDPDTPDTEPDAVDTGGCTALGCPCEVDRDCSSGYCIESTRGMMCSELCDEVCSEPGFECRLLVNAGGDAVRLCVPEADAYCESCEVALDCGDLRAHCYALNDGTNGCVTPCDEDTICPSGASCTPIPSEGDDARFCVPDAGVCEGCIDEDGDLHGVGPDCLGGDPDDTDDRVYDGAPEVCDGIDNDGNGVIDDGFDLLTDVEHCGSCEISCLADGASSACVEGVCQIEACPEGFDDCDDDGSNGCETDLSDPLLCGTCGEPEGVPGDMCGLCDTGVWTCGDDGAVTCEGEEDEDVLNACGGCGILDDEPGEACGTCDSGTWICNEEGTLDCLDDLGEGAFNSCGGCEEIEGEPGDACGTCDTGSWICASPNRTTCVGDDRDRALNECGGCSILDDEPGEPCGSCSEAVWACDGEDELVCVADPDEPGVNACGGCSVLRNEPDAACGACGLDAYACDGPDATTCDGDTRVNECGGCTVLAEVLGETCGACDAGTWSCDGVDGVLCATESGRPAPASCTIQSGPVQVGAVLGGYSSPSHEGRYSPANTVRADSFTISLHPFEVE